MCWSLLWAFYLFSFGICCDADFSGKRGIPHDFRSQGCLRTLDNLLHCKRISVFTYLVLFSIATICPMSLINQLPQIPEVHRSVNVWIFRAAGFQLILTVTFCLALEQFRGARNGLLTESLESNSLHTKMNISPVCPKVHTPNPSVHKPPSVLSSDEKQEKKQE